MAATTTPRRAAVDGAGAVYVGGTTDSPDFPTTPGAFDEVPNGLKDAFIGRVAHPIGGFVLSDPHVADLASGLGGAGVVGHQVTCGEDLNCTGTAPVAKSLRRG